MESAGRSGDDRSFSPVCKRQERPVAYTTISEVHHPRWLMTFLMGLAVALLRSQLPVDNNVADTWSGLVGSLCRARMFQLY